MKKNSQEQEETRETGTFLMKLFFAKLRFIRPLKIAILRIKLQNVNLVKVFLIFLK